MANTKPNNTFLGLSTGKVVARYFTSYATYASTSTAIPADDTIPQITEGSEILTLTTGTLASASNRLRIRYGGCFTSSQIGAACVAAVFDGANDALHNVVFYPAANNSYEYPLFGEFEYAPGATTAKTISVRYGNNSSYTMYVNGQSAARFYGGASAWTLVVEEIEP